MVKNANRRQLGKLGEDIARSFLESQGYEILEKNFCTPQGELDIIAKDKNFFCFVEVKTRLGEKLGYPEEAIDNKKQKKISALALTYLKMKGLHAGNYRFDVVSVLLESDCRIKSVKIFKDAFPLHKQYFF